MSVRYLRNRDVKKVLLGVPAGHKHLRLAVELADDKILIFSEATIANIVRAYICIKTHPIRRAIELKATRLTACPGLKEGYSEYQLLETSRDEEEIVKELSELIAEAQ